MGPVPTHDCASLPRPAWDLVDVERYRTIWVERHGYYSMNMVTTRGCPFHCNWCAKPIWGQRYAMRSPANVAEEMALLKRTLRPDHIWFADDIFGLKPGWIERFRPGLVLCGHIHNAPFVNQGSWVDRIGDTWVLNPGHQIGPVPAHIELALECRQRVGGGGVACDDQQLDAMLAKFGCASAREERDPRTRRYKSSSPSFPGYRRDSSRVNLVLRSI